MILLLYSYLVQCYHLTICCQKNSEALLFIVIYHKQISLYKPQTTVKSRLSERRLSETTGLFEDYGQSRLFFSIIYCNKTTYYSNFDYPKNSIFRSDLSVPIKEIAIKLPFKIRSPNVTHGDHDFFVWWSLFLLYRLIIR